MLTHLYLTFLRKGFTALSPLYVICKPGNTRACNYLRVDYVIRLHHIRAFMRAERGLLLEVPRMQPIPDTRFLHVVTCMTFTVLLKFLPCF